MESPNPRSVKGYELLEQLGEGAYGVVFRARQPLVDREVAVKVILPQYANQPDFIRRFETEAQLVAQLEHLHIVPLYDFWRDPDGAYLVMRLMRGGSLADSLQQDSRWEPDDAARLVDQIASALEAAHQKGVVHRDLKPANILLDEDGNAFLSDFGIAKELDADAETTQTGAILGTPAYITPEQVQSQPVTAQTDIYALGILLYQLLVGDHPFPDSSNAELVVKHLQEPLPYVRDTYPELPAALDGVIQRATAKNPSDRYPDAPSLAEDFRRALQLETTLPEISDEELYNPYKGLRAFQVADADDFFGRGKLTGQLLAHLASPGTDGHFLAVVGPSGSGKSSVVKAGLLPALLKGALPGSDQWFITEMHPGSRPVNELALALLSISADPEINLSEQLKRDEQGLLEAARTALPTKESQLLLVIDQFEELFSLVEDETERTHFLDLLHSAVTDAQGQVRVVITLRADFYDRPLMYPDFGKLVEKHTVVVLPLAPEELEQAIQKPTERVGAVLEMDLAAAISADVADQPGALPLLQYALTELFERREGRMLTNQAYQSIGGVLGALGRRAEEVYADLDQDGKTAARQIFLRLVTLGEGAEDTRRRVLRSELESLFSDQSSAIKEVIDIFGQARLLSFDHDPATRRPTVEVAHEALLLEWRRLRSWLDQSRADIRMQIVLSNATTDWLEGNEETSYLLRGSRLAQFEVWSEETSLALTTDEKRFLGASLEFEARRKAQQAALERRSRNFLRALVVVFAVAAIVAVGLTIFAFNQQGIAQDNAATAVAEADARATQQAVAESETVARAEAEKQALNERDRAVNAEHDALLQASIGLAGQALNEMDGSSPERAVPLALEALENYPYTWQAQRALGEAVLNHRLELVFSHDDVVNSLDLSRDGEQLLTSSQDGTVRIWDPSDGEEKFSLADGNPVIAKWSPDETVILTIGGKGLAIQLWDAETGSLLYSQQVDSEINYHPWNWFPWSPQGDRFVTAHDDGARVWDTATGTVLSILTGHEEIFLNASWSPSGDYIVTPSGDNTATLWDAKTGQALKTLLGTDGGVRFGAWSANGDHFALRGLDRVTVYETVTGAEVIDISLPGLWTQFTRFSPDGTKLITNIYDDGTARMWDVETGQLLSIITGLTQGREISWSPNGDLVCVVGVDGSIRVWDPITGLELQKFPFFGASFCEWSPSGDRIYGAGEDSKDIRVFELSEALLTIPGTPGIVGFGDWSPDGQQVGRGFIDGPVKVWSAASGKEVFNLNTGAGIGNFGPGLNWSPSGDRILTWNEDGTLRVWDASSGDLLRDFIGHEGGIFYGDWSPDGSQILSSGTSVGEVTVWDTATGEQIWQVAPPNGFYSFAKWSPDGKKIISTGSHGQGTIRDAATGEALLDLFPEDHPDWVEGAAWSHDGKQIVILSSGAGQIFDSTTGEVILNLSSGHTSSAWDVYWSPTDELIYTLAGDGTYRTFDAITGIELLVYETGGWPAGSLSPDGTQMLIGSNDGATSIYPTWATPEELIDYARECCVLRELTSEERDLFGLPPR